MQPPPHIYKYSPPISHSFSNLANHRFWCSHPSRFNDPFDCAESLVFRRSDEVRSDIFYDAFINADWPQMMDFAKALVEADQAADDPDNVSPSDVYFKNSLKCSVGVVCFSEVRDHMLMWGHYAASHTGFCLKFDTSFEPFRQARQVVYQTKMPLVEPSQREFGSHVDLSTFLLVKAKEWKYEREWRVLREGFNELVEYPADALAAVYIGAKASQETVETISASINRDKTRLIKMELAQDKFKLVESTL